MAVVSFSLTPEVIHAVFETMSTARAVDKKAPRAPYSKAEREHLLNYMPSPKHEKAQRAIKLREDIYAAYKQRQRMNQSRYVESLLRIALKMPALDTLILNDADLKLLSEADHAATGKAPVFKSTSKEPKKKAA